MGLFSKTTEYLKERLAKTRAKISESLTAVLSFGRKIDDDLLNELEETLIGDDIGVETTDKLISELREAYKARRISKSEEVIPFLKESIKNYWPRQNRQLRTAASGPTVILVAGVNGTGKTTSIAKLAYMFHRAGKKVIVAACDTFRAAAVEQLTIWAERIGVQIVKHQAGSDPAAVAFDACDAAVAVLHQADRIAVEVVLDVGVFLTDHVDMALEHDRRRMLVAGCRRDVEHDVADRILAHGEAALAREAPHMRPDLLLALGGARHGSQLGKMTPHGGGLQARDRGQVRLHGH